MKFVKFLSFFLLIGCQSQKDSTEIHPYSLSYQLKDKVLFNEGKIRTNNGIHFSNDGHALYISNTVDKKFRNGKSFTAIFRSDYQNGQWSQPERVNFELNIDAYHPVLSADNQTIFFNSRSHPDSTNISIPHNIWMSKRTNGKWGRPNIVEGINSEHYDSYPSVANNGNLYFNSDRDGGIGGMDIYVSYLIEGKYQTPINIAQINSEHVENDLVIDPEERFIIFNRYFHASNAIDLFISINENGVWSLPQKLDAINSDSDWELTPSLSPDGKYFFFELNNDIYQIELSAIVSKEVTN